MGSSWSAVPVAGEGAAARVLHTKINIVLEFEQVETRHRRLGDVGLELGRCEDARPGAALPGRNELVNDSFSLAEHLKIGSGVNVGTRGGVGAPYDHGLAP